MNVHIYDIYIYIYVLWVRRPGLVGPCRGACVNWLGSNLGLLPRNPDHVDISIICIKYIYIYIDRFIKPGIDTGFPCQQPARM